MMRKLNVSWIILLLSGCISPDTAEPENIPAQSELISESWDNLPRAYNVADSNDILDYLYIASKELINTPSNESLDTETHLLFAIALADYLAGEVQLPDDWWTFFGASLQGDGILIPNPWWEDFLGAFWVDIDGKGNQGILVRRLELTQSGENELVGFSPSGRILYTHNGEVHYKDVGLQNYSRATGITSKNRVAHFFFEQPEPYYTLFEIIDGILTAVFTIFTEYIVEIVDGEIKTFQKFYFYRGARPGSPLSHYNREHTGTAITEEEFEGFRQKYGLNNPQWINIPNQVNDILSIITN